MFVKNLNRNSGLTLIELLLVVGILVALAGLLLPKLDGISLKTNKGVAASNMSGLNRYIQTYRIAHNLYPDRWDSLLNGTATALQAATTPTSIGIDPQLTGLPAPAIHTKLVVSATGLTAGELVSMNRIGITQALDWVGGGAPGNGFTQLRTFAVGDKFATFNTADDDGKAVIDSIYPEQNALVNSSGNLPAGVRLMVVGFGPLNSAIGDVVDNAPTYANTDATRYYNRLLAVFEIRDNEHRAILKAVLGSDGDLMSDEITEYFEKP